MISDIGATCNICIHKFSQDGTVFETFRVLAFLELGSVFSPLGIKILVYLGQRIRTERHTTVGRWIGFSSVRFSAPQKDFTGSEVFAVTPFGQGSADDKSCSSSNMSDISF